MQRRGLAYQTRGSSSRKKPPQSSDVAAVLQRILTTMPGHPRQLLKKRRVVARLPTRTSEWTMNHLLDGAVSKWRTTFLTTFAAYIGAKHSPCELGDMESFEAMQDCSSWNHVYQLTAAAKHRIPIYDVVFVLVGILALIEYTLMGPID